jgi:selenocysteine lyase/cysteine desulfurase
MRPEEGTLDWDDFTRAVTPKTRLVAIGAASNALGTINDVARAADLAHAAGALAFVDAVHYAPHALVDVAAMDCDFLACSAYKFHGPHIGVLYGRRALLEKLDVPKLDPAPDTAPDRIETGTQNHEGIVGAARAVEYLASLSGLPNRRAALAATFDALHARGQQLFARLWDGLGAIPGVTRYGPPPSAPRTPTISFAADGHDPADVAASLADRGVFVSHGDFYATTVIERLQRAPAGLVRAGCACYTTADEIDRLVDDVARVATND